VFLSQHSRRGFIAQFPASRFLAAQMAFVQLLADDVRAEHAADPAHADELTRLLRQEFQERVLHITDFFVQAREEEILEQEASYRRGIDRAPACILMVDAAAGTIFDANHVAERLLGWSREELDGRLLEDLHPKAERSRVAALWRAALEQGHASRDDLHISPGAGTRCPCSRTRATSSTASATTCRSSASTSPTGSASRGSSSSPRRWRPSDSSPRASRTSCGTRSPS
jgi:PAS domain S-box-containing protein